MFVRIGFLVLLLAGAGCSWDRDTEINTGAVANSSAVPAPSTIASGAPGRAAFASAPDRGDLTAYPVKPVIRRDGAYTWHRADLSEAHALAAIAGGRLTVTAPSGELLNFRYERHQEHPSGDWTWIGRLENGGVSDETILTFGSDAVFGTVAQPGKEPLRLTIRDGVSWLVETDRNAVGRIDNSATRPHRPDFFIPPKQRATSATGIAALDSAASIPNPAGATASATPTATTTVDVVLGYTSGFATGLGGQSQAITRLNFLVEVSNQAYANSQVEARVRLVHAIQVDYPDATANSTALEELTGFRAPSTQTTPAAVFSALRAARDQYGADLVSLVRKFNTPENDGCGIAWLIGGGQSGIDGSDQYFGYSVISDGIDAGMDGKNYFCRDETLAHELGHNMGSQHDRTTATVDGVLKYGVYPYSFGYKTGADGFYTVMAYGDTGQTRYRVFSNPRINYCNGPCGIADNADNARSLGQTIPMIAAFRATVVPGAFVGRRNDLNGDGYSDILFNNKTMEVFTYWMMQGHSRIGTGNQAVSRIYDIVGTGDFDGDGVVEVLWGNNTNDLLWIWKREANGTAGFHLVSGHSPDWRVVGTGDIDGDGRADILLYNSNTEVFTYWLMHGTTIVGSGNQGASRIYRVVGTGDINNDGRDDVIWTNQTSDLLWIWSRQADGTAGFRMIGRYASGWSVAGVDDVNADGYADILFNNSALGVFTYWLMNDTRIVSTGNHAVSGLYTIAAFGDYDGDGATEVYWTNASRDLLWVWDRQPDGSADFRFLGGYSSAWQVQNF